MPQTTLTQSHDETFLRSAGLGRTIHVGPGEAIFSQGDRADTVFYIQKGRAKLTVTSVSGKEATIFLLSAGNFAGEEAILSPVGDVRPASAIAITGCTVLKIERERMARAVQDGHSFSEMLLSFLLIRNIRVQADLVDHLFNNSEKRLARVLLLMADITESDGSVTLIPPITQETLAEIVGTTRPRINFFMNRFRQLGFIEYHHRIRVHKSLLNVVLHE